MGLNARDRMLSLTSGVVRDTYNRQETLIEQMDSALEWLKNINKKLNK